MDPSERKLIVLTMKGEFKYFDIDFQSLKISESYKSDVLNSIKTALELTN